MHQERYLSPLNISAFWEINCVSFRLFKFDTPERKLGHTTQITNIVVIVATELKLDITIFIHGKCMPKLTMRVDNKQLKLAFTILLCLS
jgi:hypothetical protein